MPEKKTTERARAAKREGKAPSTQAGEFVREEIEHVRAGKHGAKSAKQAIAIGLAKARRAGVELPPPPAGTPSREREPSATKAPSKRAAGKRAPAKKAPAKKAAAKKAAAKKAPAKKRLTAGRPRRQAKPKTTTAPARPRRKSPTRARGQKPARSRAARSPVSPRALSRQARRAALGRKRAAAPARTGTKRASA